MGSWLDQVFWGFDSAIYNFVTDHVANPVLDQFFKVITHFGDGGVFWIVLGIVFLFFKKLRKCGFMMLFALCLGALVTDVFVKESVARVRPYLTHPEIAKLFHLIPPEKSFSFPSGHTTASFAAGVVMFCSNKKWGTAGLVFAFLIAFSRIYVYVHYPTDVLAGMIVGTLAALVAFFLGGMLWDKVSEKLKEKRRKKKVAAA